MEEKNTLDFKTAKEIKEQDMSDDSLVAKEIMKGKRIKDTIINEDGSVTRIYEQTIDRPTPEDLKKWNWGAFFFNWLWGVCNGVYWPLAVLVLTFIFQIVLFPLGSIISLGLSVYLGIKGTELSWDAKTWDSFDSFKKTQHKWAVAVVWVCAITIVLSFIIGLLSAL